MNDAIERRIEKFTKSRQNTVERKRIQQNIIPSQPNFESRKQSLNKTFQFERGSLIENKNEDEE
jgi:hypothetical protein